MLRCYADRILYPKHYVPKNVRYVRHMPKLTCSDCDAIIGTPSRCKRPGANRLAFNMIKTSSRKKISIHVTLVK